MGKILMEQCAGTIKKMSLELGGNAPYIVFDDADLDAAVDGAMIAKFRNNGRTCVCADRIYVQAGVYDAFAAKLAAKVRELSVGNGFHEGVTSGPMINQTAVDKGGTRSNLGGTFFAPTVVRDVTRGMQVCREETFGSLAALVPFETEAEVIDMANDSEFGLASYFYSNDLSRVWRMSEALESGMARVNTGLVSTKVAPLGGSKKSALGRNETAARLARSSF